MALPAQLMQLFGGTIKPAGPVATPTPTTATGNPTNPGDPTALTNPAVTSSPLDAFKTLWEAPKDAPAATSLVPVMTADPKEVLAKARTVDFTAAISQEVMDKAMKGDAAAFRAVINEAAQSSYAQGALASLNISKSGFTQLEKVMESGYLAAEVRKQAIKAEMGRDNSPLLSNPAILPMINMVEQQLSKANPNATPLEIKSMASDYLTNFAGEIAKAGGNNIVPIPRAKVNKSEDWDAFAAS